MLDGVRRWFEHVLGRDTVTVKAGESLWRIAEDVTGDGARWKELADANPDRNWTKDYIIHPGDELKLPESWL